MKIYNGQSFKSEVKEKTDDMVLRETYKRKNIKLYNRYINEAAKRKSLPLAKNLFQQLQEQSLQPNEFTYTCMVNACSRSHDMVAAEWYLRAMQDEKLAPNEITWTALIKGATALFDLAAACKYLDEMQASGVPPNLRTYNTILRACFRMGDAKTATDLVKNRMKKHHIKPDFTTLQALTQIQAQAMSINEASDSASYLEALIDAKKSKQEKSASKTPLPLKSKTEKKLKDAKESKMDIVEENDEEKTQNTEKVEREFVIDPSLYLLLASTALLSGSMLKRVRQYMEKFDSQVSLLKSLSASENSNPENEAVPPEMLMEANYLRPYLEKDEGLSKKVTELTKLGPGGSPFVKKFELSPSAPSASSREYLWPVSKTEGKSKKRKLEICSGSGDWVIARAQKDKKSSDWAALEIRYDRVHEIWRRVVLNQLENNVTILHADAAHLDRMIPTKTVDEIFVNFPDPPHTRWSAQRMVTPSLLKSLANVLVPGGTVIIATDDFDYIRWIQDDSKSLGDYFDVSKTAVSKSIEDYGTSYFDGLWSSRGRKDRAFLTLTAL